MRFTKMQGIGNDYIYVNCFTESVPDPARAAQLLSDRRFGGGGDGLILIEPSQVADFRMRIFNADGSEAQMCGNGIRCVGKYVHDRGLTDARRLTVETGAGIKTLELTLAPDGTVQLVRVDMGAPVWQPEKVPVLADAPVVDAPLDVAGGTWRVSCLSMGNPHCVTFAPDVEALDLPAIGPAFENCSRFPERINTEFVQVLPDGRLRMRVWERGAGETWACGTGACAVFAAAQRLGLCGTRAEILLRGGALTIEQGAAGSLFMTGPAAFVFDGTVLL